MNRNAIGGILRPSIINLQTIARMMPISDLTMFAGAAFLMALSPGPNMIYLVSRSICQGPKAGVISLFGVMAGFFVHMLAAAVGITAVLMAVPLVSFWPPLRLSAWQALKPGARSPFEARTLPPDSPARLFFMGFLTNALNPKIAVFYLSVFPQFVSPEHGSIFAQSLALGCTQIVVSFTVNLLIALFAAKIASWFASNPGWMKLQRYFMGLVLGALAVRLLFEQRRV